MELALIAAGLALFFFVLPHSLVGDDVQRARALKLLFDTGQAPPGPYSLLGPVFSSPLYWLGTVWKTPEWWLGRYNVVLLALALLTAYRLVRPHLRGPTARRFLLVMLGASMFPSHLMHYGAETFTALCASVGVMVVCLRRGTWGWSLVVLGVINTPAALAGMAAASVYNAVAERRWRHLLFIALAVGGILFESWWRRGHPLRSGYENNAGARTALPYSGLPGFSYPFFHGLLSLLFSFGKGLVFFAPGLLLPVRGVLEKTGAPLARLYLALVVFVVGLLLIYAKWWSWYGGWSWGPRFFLIASVPASLAIAVKLTDREAGFWSRLWLLLILTLSAWIGLSSVVFQDANLNVCAENGYRVEAFCWYVPEMSVLWRPFTVRPPMTATMWTLTAYFTVVYLYLAIPLVAGLVRQAARAAWPWVTANLHPRQWRF